jgi:hypothetical protein
MRQYAGAMPRIALAIAFVLLNPIVATGSMQDIPAVQAVRPQRTGAETRARAEANDVASVVRPVPDPALNRIVSQQQVCHRSPARRPRLDHFAAARSWQPCLDDHGLV